MSGGILKHDLDVNDLDVRDISKHCLDVGMETLLAWVRCQ